MAIIHSVSPGFKKQVSAPPPAKKTAGLIEKENLFLQNVEGWNRFAQSFLK
jgi:hypothetical protein